MTPTRLRMTDRSTKWGLVTVRSAEGGIEREVAIDGREADRVATSVASWPCCVTQEEWESGLVTSATYAVLPGQANAAPDGTLVVCLGLRERAQCVDAVLLGLHKTEWAEVDGVIGVRGPAAQMIREAGW